MKNNIYDVLDWQSFSQKKNIEEVAKNTRTKKAIELTAITEIFMMICSIVAENLFSEDVAFIWIIIFIISFAPIAFLIFKALKNFISKKLPGSDISDVNELIDLFDNDVCYFTLMADSYCSKLRKSRYEKITSNDQFYFIETCFYVSKVIYSLSRMSNCCDRLFSKKSEDVYCDRNISYVRLQNIFDILDNVIQILDDKFFMIESIDPEMSYYQLHQKYLKTYKEFKRIVM